MNDMARLLGKYQKPAVVFDTSTLVSLGQHDLATVSAVERLRRDLWSASQSAREEPYDLIIFEHVAGEYRRFFEQGVSGEYGIPKASNHILEQLDCSEFPSYLNNRVVDARKIWAEASPKSAGNSANGKGPVNLRNALSQPSRTDQELLAFVLEQAENQRTCYVFSRDNDIIGPVKKLESTHPCVHYMGYSVERPSVLAGRKKPVLIMPEVVGALYNLAPSKPFEYYLLSAKVPFAGEEVDAIVSMHPVEGRLKVEDGRASRHLLHVHDLDKLLAVKGYEREVFRSRENNAMRAAARGFEKDYATLSFIDAAKLKDGGLLRMAQLKRKLVFDAGRLSSQGEAPELEWFTVYPSYLREFSPETYHYVSDFRRAFPR